MSSPAVATITPVKAILWLRLSERDWPGRFTMLSTRDSVFGALCPLLVLGVELPGHGGGEILVVEEGVGHARLNRRESSRR